MKVSNLNIAGEGLSRHTNSSKILIDSIPKLLFSKVFSFSDKQSERFLAAIEILYQDAVIKPIFDIIAIHIAKNDDLVIMFDASAGHSTLGKYTSNRNEFKDRINSLPPEEKELAAKVLSVILPTAMSSNNSLKKIEIQTMLFEKNLYSIIAHEFSHLISELIFNNYALGYANLEQKYIFDKCFAKMAMKLVQFHNSQYESKIYPTVNGREILNIECMRVIFAELDNQRNSTSNNSVSEKAFLLHKFLSIFFIPSQEYPDSGAIDYEIFARIFEAHIKWGDKEWTPKFLSEFNSYFEHVLNPTINKYINDNLQTAQALGIKPNKLGSYGFNIEDITKEWNLDEKLYFSIVSDDIELAYNLMSMGANPNNEFVLGVHKIINVALKRGQYDLVKFMIKNYKDFDLISKDFNDKTTIDIAKELGDAAYDCLDLKDQSLDSNADLLINYDQPENTQLVLPIDDCNSI